MRRYPEGALTAFSFVPGFIHPTNGDTSMSRVTKCARPSRLALAATASLAALSICAATASADAGIAGTSPFRLDLGTLEPGCTPAIGGDENDVASFLKVSEFGNEAHIRVLSGANFSVDQVLVPGDTGYAVYNAFDTGVTNNDADIDPGQTATGLRAPN